MGGIGGSDTDELDRLIVEDHNQMEEVRQSRTLAIQLQVKMPGTSQGTTMWKRKGLYNMNCSQTNSKKSRVEESQPTVISVLSVNVKEMIAEKKREALAAKTHSPELKKQRMSEETDVQAQGGLSKRQKTEGQSGTVRAASV